MKPLDRLTHRVIFRSGIIVVAATMVLALSATSARHVGLDVLAATVIGVSSAPFAAAENNDTTGWTSISSTSVLPTRTRCH